MRGQGIVRVGVVVVVVLLVLDVVVLVSLPSAQLRVDFRVLFQLIY